MAGMLVQTGPARTLPPADYHVHRMTSRSRRWQFDLDRNAAFPCALDDPIRSAVTKGPFCPRLADALRSKVRSLVGQPSARRLAQQQLVSASIATDVPERALVLVPVVFFTRDEEDQRLNLITVISVVEAEPNEEIH